MTGTMEPDPMPIRRLSPQPSGADGQGLPYPIRAPQRRRPFPPVVNLLFFLATVLTTLISGTLIALDDMRPETIWHVLAHPYLWDLGLPYAAPLLLILSAHEMGHYVACRIYGIDASLPFFIPGLPVPFGTFGAVIRIRAPITTRRALFDIGVAGPIAGFVVAIPVLLYGLWHSTVSSLPPPEGTLILPLSPMLTLLVALVLPADQGSVILTHPSVAAAWLGLFATFLNLLPIGQLDGGHMVYALSRRAHQTTSRLALPALIVAGLLFGGEHLIVFGVLLMLLGTRHPPVLDESGQLGRARIAVAWLGLVIFLLCFTPGGLDLI